MPAIEFPKSFLWGAAASSYQIEGAVAEDGRSESIWDRFSHTPGAIAGNDNGDIACDHYHRWREDIAIMQEIGIKAYRLSIAWPRVIPGGTGPVNEAGLAFYDQLIDALIAAGIEPWVTLYHWDLPQVLQDVGGWTNRATVEAFATFTDAVTRRLGDRVTNWITINEPWCASLLRFQIGLLAAGHMNWSVAVASSHHLLLAHGIATDLIRANVPGARVGIALNPTSVYSATDSAEDHGAALRFDGYINRWFLDPLYGRGYPEDMLALYSDFLPPIAEDDLRTIAAPTDFLAINYYTPSYMKNETGAAPLSATGIDLPEREHTAMGWMVEPRGLHDLLVRLERDYNPGPIYITENGAACDDPEPSNGVVHDPERIAYLDGHIRAMHSAIREGVPLAGYFVWSLLDNFEWAEGYARRFGVVHVDFESQRRTIKASGHWFGRVIGANGLGG